MVYFRPTATAVPSADLDAVIIVYDVADAASQTTYATAHPEEPWLNELKVGCHVYFRF